MATFQSDLIQKRTRCNVINDGETQDFTATYVYEIGAQVTSGDIIQLADISPLHVMTACRVFTSDLDDGTTLTSNWGFAQIVPGLGYGGVNASGVATELDVASGVLYTSPASSASYYVNASTVGRAAGWSSLTLATLTDPTGPGGPIRFQLAWSATPTQTTADDAQRIIRVQFTLAKVTPTGTNFVNMGGY